MHMISLFDCVFGATLSFLTMGSNISSSSMTISPFITGTEAGAILGLALGEGGSSV